MTPLEDDMQIDVRQRQARTAQRVLHERPSPLPFFVTFVIALCISLYIFDGNTTILGWILTFIWSLPVVSTTIGVYGIFVARRKMAETRQIADNVRASRHDKLLVVVPTIGRHDTYPALERSVISYIRHLPAYFPYLRIDVITE